MTNPSWGTKRTCPSCSAHFYDLQKLPAICPKCSHSFDPTAIARVKRKAVKREAPKPKENVSASVLASKRPVARKKDPKELDIARDTEGGIGDIAEIEDVDDIENLKDLSELEEREENPIHGDDADDEAIIDDLDAGEKTLVGNVEDEEAKVLVEEIEDEELASSSAKKAKPKKKTK